MQVISKISVDLRHPNIGARVDAVQNDVNTRVVEISLFDGGAAWTVPAGINAAVGYRKPDNKKGVYDKLADGTAAVTISGSTITVILAQQMLTTPGEVSACIVLNDADLNQLTSFPFSVSVASNPAADAQQSDDYIRLEWLEEKLDEYLQQVGSGGTVDVQTVQKIVDDYLAANPPAGGITEIPIATDKVLGGVKVGENLRIDDGVLSVKTATAVEADNTLPITSAAVNTTVGNIEILLATI